MLKLAVIGAQTLLGRELAQALEPRASVLPLSTSALTPEQEEGDQVLFAPDPALLLGLDAAILVETPPEGLLEDFIGRVLDLRPERRDGEKPLGEPMPLRGAWPAGVPALHARPALDQVLALLPVLVESLGEVSGTHLRAVAHLGDVGLQGLHEQTSAVLRGEEPETEGLGYRAAFEAVPMAARGSLVEVRVPVFHGDLLVLNLRAVDGGRLVARKAPAGVRWTDTPPSSRDVAVSPELLANLSLSSEGRNGMLVLGFDPILWGALRPALRLLELAEV